MTTEGTGRPEIRHEAARKIARKWYRDFGCANQDLARDIDAALAETAAERDRLREALARIEQAGRLEHPTGHACGWCIGTSDIARAALAATAKPKEPADHE